MVKGLSKRAVSLAFCLVAAQSAWAQKVGYTVTELPPLETEIGPMTSIDATAINNAGHVVGLAVSTVAPFEGQRAAFFYSEETGMVDLDPDREYFSNASVISNEGWIYGETAGRERIDSFLYDTNLNLVFFTRNLDQNGVEVLEPMFHPFTLWDMNAFGDLVGSGNDGRKPVMYIQDDGWIDLSDVDPRLGAEGGGVARLINDVGDLVFTHSPPGGFQESFVLLGGEELVELGHFGTAVNVPTEINNSRQISGISRTAGSDPNVQADGDDHAYFFSPTEGVLDITPNRYRQGEAMGINEEGVVLGLLYRGDGRGGIFTYDPERSKKLRFLARRKHFRRLFSRDQSFQFRPPKVEPIYFNEHNQLIGAVEAQKTDAGKRPRRFFFMSRKKRVLDLQEILDSTGYEGEITNHIDINDRGQILLEVKRPGPDTRDRPRSASVILTPID